MCRDGIFSGVWPLRETQVQGQLCVLFCVQVPGCGPGCVYSGLFPDPFTFEIQLHTFRMGVGLGHTSGMPLLVRIFECFSIVKQSNAK